MIDPETIILLRRRLLVSHIPKDELATMWKGLHLPQDAAEEHQKNNAMTLRAVGAECVEWKQLIPGRRLLVQPFRMSYVGRGPDDEEMFVILESDVRAIIISTGG